MAVVKAKYTNSLVLLGEGSFNKVYKGYNASTGESVAIKKPKNSKANVELQKEIKNLTSLPPHENVIKVLDFIHSSKNSYMILEYCEGESLYSYMTTQLKNSFGVEVPVFNSALIDISAGYKHLRDNNLAHRDIKPDNIMISFSKYNGSVTYKIADLGCAKKYSENGNEKRKQEEQLVSLTGTPDFMCPMMLRRKLALEKRSKLKLTKKKMDEYTASIDLWPIGCTLMYIACNCHAWAASTEDQLSELHDKKVADSIRGVYEPNGEAKFFNTFRDLSPINKTASEQLKQSYISILIECFKPLEEASIDEYFAIVDKITKQGISYQVDIDTGSGKFDILKELLKDENNGKIFALKSVTHFCKALKFTTPVFFFLRPDDAIEIKKLDNRFNRSDEVGSNIEVICSHCQCVASIIANIQHDDFNVKVLKLLCLKIVDDQIFNEIERKSLNDHERIVDMLNRQIIEVDQIFKDVSKTGRKIELDALVKRCERIEGSVQTNAIKCMKNLQGKQRSGKDNTGLLYSMCSAIKSASAVMKNTTIY